MVKNKQAIVAIIQNEDIKRAVHESLKTIGGIKKLVPPRLGRAPTFLIKPNACRPAEPNSGVVTNFRVVEAVIEEVRAVGGIPIVGESCIGSSPQKTEKALRDAGIWKAAEELGAKIVNFDLDEEVKMGIPKGKALKKIGIAKTALKCDIRISVPVLKYHPTATVTLGLKNMKGCLPGPNKGETHACGLHQAIADYNTILKPNLVVIDGTIAGAWGKLPEPIRLNIVIAGFDPVATDAVGSLILGVDPNTVEHLRRAAEFGLGILATENIKIMGIQPERVSLKRLYSD